MDFKREWWKFNEDMDEFLKDICSMANTHTGDNYIIIGVDMYGKLFDAPMPHDEAILQAKHKDKIEPKVNLSWREFEIEGSMISVVEIPHSKDRPHVIKKYKNLTNYIPIRFGSTTVTASRADLDEMYKERQETERTNLKIDFADEQVRWGNNVGFKGNCFMVKLDLDTYESNVPDYITQVSLTENSGDHWRGDQFMFEGRKLNEPYEVQAKQMVLNVVVYISDSQPDGLNSKRLRPNIDLDTIQLEITTRSGTEIVKKIKPGWIKG